jgi:hypothetical protein
MDAKSIALVLVFMAAWIGLNRWVLPWFGFNTCMSGACSVDRRPVEDRIPPVSSPAVDVRAEDDSDVRTPTP